MRSSELLFYEVWCYKGAAFRHSSLNWHQSNSHLNRAINFLNELRWHEQANKHEIHGWYDSFWIIYCRRNSPYMLVLGLFNFRCNRWNKSLFDCWLTDLLVPQRMASDWIYWCFLSRFCFVVFQFKRSRLRHAKLLYRENLATFVQSSRPQNRSLKNHLSLDLLIVLGFLLSSYQLPLSVDTLWMAARLARDIAFIPLKPSCYVQSATIFGDTRDPQKTLAYLSIRKLPRHGCSCDPFRRSWSFLCWFQSVIAYWIVTLMRLYLGWL